MRWRDNEQCDGEGRDSQSPMLPTISLAPGRCVRVVPSRRSKSMKMVIFRVLVYLEFVREENDCRNSDFGPSRGSRIGNRRKYWEYF